MYVDACELSDRKGPLSDLRGHVRAYEIGVTMGVPKLMVYAADRVGEHVLDIRGQNLLKALSSEYQRPSDHPIGRHIDFALRRRTEYGIRLSGGRKETWV
jgi:hypothetical protein